MKNKNDLHHHKFDLSQIFGHIIKRLRHRKTIAIGVIALSIIILTQLCINNIREARSTHYLKTIGSCNQTTNVKIYDETGGIDPTGIQTFDGTGDYTYSSKPVNTIENKHFKNYVTTISKYVFAKVEAMGLCQTAASQPQVDLVFVYRPAISRGIKPFDLQLQKSKSSRALGTPWVKMTIDLLISTCGQYLSGMNASFYSIKL